MDNWDPLVINSFAIEREVILFNNAGMGVPKGKHQLLF
jgi:hypothetical protein